MIEAMEMEMKYMKATHKHDTSMTNMKEGSCPGEIRNSNLV